MRRPICAALALGCAILGSGCETTGEPPPPTTPGVSNIPWNRPEQWEGTTGIPGIANPGSY